MSDHPAKRPQFHFSISDMLVENASYVPHSSFPTDVATALRESQQVNLFFDVGFVQQGKLQICLSREEAGKLFIDIFDIFVALRCGKYAPKLPPSPEASKLSYNLPSDEGPETPSEPSPTDLS
ncbi:MAG: hypothetical protein L0Y56_03515 [Nitrospira sp.]|nr:hypothetical protein [Nitrospira sp.]